jgi:NADH dehydrogenase [ubiquinone] 1 alpha subcomplex assembly factor 7
MILVANELLDCLPARQFVRTESGWAERVIGLGEDGELAFGLRGLGKSPDAAPLHLPEANPGSVWESSPPQAALASDIAHRLADRRRRGAADRLWPSHAGSRRHAAGDPGHQKVDPLKTAGLADLTVWADFPSVVAAARETGAKAGPILSQAEFLLALGHRGPRPGVGEPPGPIAPNRSQDSLIAWSDEAQMGALFKVACLCAPDLSPPLFEDAT